MSLAPTRCDVLQALVHERVVLCELAVGEHCCEDNALHRSSARTLQQRQRLAPNRCVPFVTA